MEALVGDLRKRLCRPASLPFSEQGEATMRLVTAHKAELMDTVSQHPVVIVQGSTGCGKSTGIPRMLLEDMDVLELKLIICTQVN